MSNKPTNPKDIIGSKKLPLELIPEIPGEALPFLEGALKYGRFNWRIAGVRASIYYAAMRRHQKKWWNGQDADTATRIHHLLSVMACCRIVLDAELAGKLTDDRPPRQNIDEAIREAEEICAHLREMFKDHHPKQYTIADVDYDADALGSTFTCGECFNPPERCQCARRALDEHVPCTCVQVAGMHQWECATIQTLRRSPQAVLPGGGSKGLDGHDAEKG